jgi:G3E family GTPase
MAAQNKRGIMTKAIPTNLILGFLGVGKTTAILDLLKSRPEGEVWAVLVNEFGEVGIDGALLQTDGAFVKEVPGGCMCCVAGLPMQVGLNQLIKTAKPDRLIIEPTGLGHPAQILETLTSEHYATVLELGPVITLVDPRKLNDQRVLDNVQFRDQVAAADILVANKTDLCTRQQLAHFEDWAKRLEPEKAGVFQVCQGQLNPAWLTGEMGEHDLSAPDAHRHYHQHEAPAPVPIEEQPWQLAENSGQGYVSIGWRVHPEQQFDENSLLMMAMAGEFVRFKAVVHTTAGWRTINSSDGALSVAAAGPRELSRIEVISPEALDAAGLDKQLRQAVR